MHFCYEYFFIPDFLYSPYSAKFINGSFLFFDKTSKNFKFYRINLLKILTSFQICAII